MTGTRRGDLPLPGPGTSRAGSGTKTAPDLRRSAVAAGLGHHRLFGAHPTIAAAGAMTGHGATGMAELPAAYLVARTFG